jgi:hypothetical protein
MMLKKFFTLILLSFLVTSCVSGPDGYFKKSANNKLFDRKGYHGGKRSPLYNKKYIHQAKKNVARDELEEDDFEDDEDLYENYSISRNNQDMYRQMIQQDIERDKKRKGRAYPSLTRANARVGNHHDAENSELREEIEEIRSMLQDAKRDLSSYKCPTAESIEQRGAHKKSSTVKHRDVNNPRTSLESI